MASPARALTVTGYTSVTNGRFSSGYALNPVPNADPGFIGAAYDWSGVGWTSNLVTKSFPALSPSHYLVANHYEFTQTLGINFLGGDDVLHTYHKLKVENTGFGTPAPSPDLSIGTLTSALVPDHQIAVYSVLDLGTPPGYVGQTVYVYGHGGGLATQSPVIGTGTVAALYISGVHTNFVTARTSVQLQDKDSGGPVFIPWVNPVGGAQLTIIGNHVSTNETYNFHNFIAAGNTAAAIDALMVDDGWAIHWVGTPTRTWLGDAAGPADNKNKLSATGNWSGGSASDQYVVLDGDTTAYLNLVPGADLTIRGLYFRDAASGLGFTFGDDGTTLTIGRGGITNYDPLNRQSFAHAIALGANQYWDGGGEGITVAGNVNNNGNLLVFRGAGTNRLNGILSGGGGLTQSGSGVLALTAANTYTGMTLVAEGALRVNNVEGSGTGTGRVVVAASGTLGGSGRLAPGSGQSVTIGGALDPGNSVGTLTFALGGSSKLEFLTGSVLNFEADTPGASDLIRFETLGDWLSGSGLAALNIIPGPSFDYASNYVLFTNVTTTGFSFAEITGHDEEAYVPQVSYVTDRNYYELNFSVIPEPQSVVLFGLAAAVLAQARRRRLRR